MKLRMKPEHVLAILFIASALITTGVMLKIFSENISSAMINTVGTYLIAIGIGELVGIPIIAIAMLTLNAGDKIVSGLFAGENPERKDISW